MNRHRQKVTVLFSGRGSNLRSLIMNAEHFTVSTIICDNPEAGGLEYAEEFGIKATLIEAGAFSSKKLFKAAILEAVKSSAPNFVCLAGYMQIVQPEFVQQFPNKILNIHPSLLPQFPGLHTHQRALQSGATEHGCTVHFVDEGIDTGAVIAQCKVGVLSSDNEETLSAKVLEREHFLYPWVANFFAAGQILFDNGKVIYSPKVVEDAKRVGIILGG